MKDFKYTPDKEQKVHAPGAITLICKPFQSHENGLPEFCKNSADAYAREGASIERRKIVLLFSDQKSLGKPAMGCLDFVGTSSDKIEKYFRHWADPDAAKQDTDFKVQGGHGNGGKCYMTQMFEDHAVFYTVRENKGCNYGVKGGTTQFGYVPDISKGRDFKVTNLSKELNAHLIEFGSSLDSLPKSITESFSECNGFTLVKGVGPKYYERKISVKNLITQIRDHSQMISTLEYCEIFIIYNGKVIKEYSPLKPSKIEPIPGSEDPRVIEIPEFLKDPINGNKVLTATGNERGKLVLSTSNTSMRYKKKYRHTINYKTNNGFIGFKNVTEFPCKSGFQEKIYGVCELNSLEQFKQNDRRNLSDAPLTRAIDEFIAQKIEEFAEVFEEKERRKYSKQERNELSRINEALDRWKNQFIKNFIDGAFSGSGTVTPDKRLPSGTPSRIEISSSYSRLGIGVAIRPRIRFFDASGKQIRSVPYRWVSENNNVAMVEDELMLINSFSPGETMIWAETFDGILQSNRIPLQVMRIWSIDLEPQEVNLYIGSQTRLKAICHLNNNEIAEDVALIWTEGNTSIARVNPSGVVFGVSGGFTEITAGDDKVTAKNPSIIKVTEDDHENKKSERSGKNKRQGQGYPLILVSGEVDRDPLTDEYVILSPDHPPVYQRPIDTDRNLWWINSSSPLAKMYLDKRDGCGYDSREWRMYHTERYIDIITEIAMTYDPQLDGAITVKEYSLYRSDKLREIHAAIASELEQFIKLGILPKVE